MKTLKKWMAVLLTAAVLFSMSGCRDTSVIEKIIYDYLRTQQTDMEKNAYDDKEDKELDDFLHDLEKDTESERENDAEEVEPVYAPEEEPTQTQTAGAPNYSEDGGENSTAAVAPVPDSDGTLSGGASQGEGETDAPPEEPGEGSNPDESGDVGVGGGYTVRLVVDDYGNQYEVPENVDSVAAVDSAAVAVLMLGGVDRLAATNADLTSDPLATDAFSGLSAVPALWAGSGANAPLDSAALQSLIEIHPDVCFETSGSATFSDEQVETLLENGICYVALPAPTSATNLKLITQVVGEVLGDHTGDGGYDSVSRYQEYRSWVDDTLAAVTQAEGSAVYTLYVDGWDPEAYYTIAQAKSFYGYGAAVINTPKTESCMAVNSFLAGASVTNVTGLGEFVRKETVYFTPFDGNWSTISIAGPVATKVTMVTTLESGGYLGSDGFQTVIASSASVKAGLESSQMWKNFGLTTSSNGNFTSYGFLDDSGEIVRSAICGDYNVIVNPRGIGSWATGSVESVLETVWASYALAGGCSESDLRATVSDFYSTFYHYTLSDSQLDAILAGEA